MGAGVPNYQKLYEMGKLPKSARGNVPMLAQLDAAEKRIEEIKKAMCDDCRERIFGVELEKEDKSVGDKSVEDKSVEVKCEVEGCDYMATGRTEGVARNILRLHNRTHEAKE